MKKIKIKIKNEAHKKAIIARLKEMGLTFSWRDELFKDFVHVDFDRGFIYHTNGNKGDFVEKTLDDLYEDKILPEKLFFRDQSSWVEKTKDGVIFKTEKGITSFSFLNQREVCKIADWLKETMDEVDDVERELLVGELEVGKNYLVVSKGPSDYSAEYIVRLNEATDKNIYGKYIHVESGERSKGEGSFPIKDCSFFYTDRQV